MSKVIVDYFLRCAIRPKIDNGHNVFDASKGGGLIVANLLEEGVWEDLSAVQNAELRGRPSLVVERGRVLANGATVRRGCALVLSLYPAPVGEDPELMVALPHVMDLGNAWRAADGSTAATRAKVAHQGFIRAAAGNWNTAALADHHRHEAYAAVSGSDDHGRTPRPARGGQ